MATSGKSEMLTEWFCEARYEPVGRFLNFKGSIADRLKEELTFFKHWAIGENKVDFHNRDDETDEVLENETAFVGYRNIGYSLARPSTKDHFPDKSIKFIKSVFTSPKAEFPLPPVNRIGVRVRAIVPYEGSFESLQQAYHRKLVGPYQEIEAIFGCPISDSAVNFDFVHKNARSSKLRSGPMEAKQMEKFLKITDDLPANGLYFDVDIFRNYSEPTKLDANRLATTVSEYSEGAWGILERLSEPILSK